MASYSDHDLLRAGAWYLESVKRRSRFEWIAHLVTLGCALVAVLVSESLPVDRPERAQAIITAGLLGGLLEAVAWVVRRGNDRRFVIGRRLRRLSLAANGLGVAWEPQDDEDEAVIAKAGTVKNLSVDDYYTSKLPPGWARVLDNVQESAFFSWKLYLISSWIVLGLIALFFIAAIALCVYMFMHHDALAGIALIGHMILVITSFAAGSGLLDQYTRWREAARECAHIVKVSENLKHRRSALPNAEFENRVLILYADYAAITLGAPPPPTWLYLGTRDKLTRKHAEEFGAQEVSS